MSSTCIPIARRSTAVCKSAGTIPGADVTCVQVAGLIARRILCYVHEGDSLARGQRFGFIRFGSRVDIYVPEDANLVAALGDKVYATSSVIATLPHHA